MERGSEKARLSQNAEESEEPRVYAVKRDGSGFRLKRRDFWSVIGSGILAGGVKAAGQGAKLVGDCGGISA
jgi:hypothetical protein